MTVRDIPVPVFLMAISAPTMTPPDESVTVPETVAPTTCAFGGGEATPENSVARRMAKLIVNTHLKNLLHIIINDLPYFELARLICEAEPFLELRKGSNINRGEYPHTIALQSDVTIVHSKSRPSPLFFVARLPSPVCD